MGRTVKRLAPVNPVVELLDLVSPRVTEDGEDPNVFTRRELETLWKKSDRATIIALRHHRRGFAHLGQLAERKGLHGIISVKAYRLTL